MRRFIVACAFTFIILPLIIITPAHAALNLEGLVGLWLLDDAKGDVAKDSSPNGNDGTLDGAAKWDKGKFNGGLVTAAQNGITVPVSESLDTVVDAISLGGWFRVDTDSDTGLRRDSSYLLEDQSTSETTPDAWAFTVWTGGTYQPLVWGKIKIVKGEWTHIAGTYDGKTASLYVNGELDVSEARTGKIDRPANPLGLGKYSSETYVGGLDEIFLFNRALSQNEIKDLMKGYKSALMVSAANEKLATTWGSLKLNK